MTMEPRTADPSLMYFATSEKHRAIEFLKSPLYSYLPDAAKDYVIRNLSRDLMQGFRVQDPSMHQSPQLMTQNRVHYDNVLKMMLGKAEG